MAQIKNKGEIYPSRKSEYDFFGPDFEANPNFNGIQKFGNFRKGAFIEMNIPNNLLVPSPSPIQNYFFRVNTGSNNFLIKPTYNP